MNFCKHCGVQIKSNKLEGVADLSFAIRDFIRKLFPTARGSFPYTVGGPESQIEAHVYFDDLSFSFTIKGRSNKRAGDLPSKMTVTMEEIPSGIGVEWQDKSGTPEQILKHLMTFFTKIKSAIE